ncbi:hypothetical protein [Pedobacter jeongneungensis]|nr:hypothetical protein [Pedobacter jeongneungensis]
MKRILFYHFLLAPIPSHIQQFQLTLENGYGKNEYTYPYTEGKIH